MVELLYQVLESDTQVGWDLTSTRFDSFRVQMRCDEMRKKDLVDRSLGALD